MGIGCRGDSGDAPEYRYPDERDGRICGIVLYLCICIGVRVYSGDGLLYVSCAVKV